MNRIERHKIKEQNAEAPFASDGSIAKLKKLSQDEMPLVSVIMPVYNAEAFLIDSVMSLVYQTYKNIEIICVDDGSTDLSLNILNKIKNDNPSRKIKIISQENLGPAAARNKGLDNAEGEYIAFLDSDDYVEPETYSELTRLALKNNADIVVFGGVTFPKELPWENWVTKKISPPNKIYSMEEAGKLALLRENSSKPFMWQQFIKRDLIEADPKLRMDEKFELGEDQIFIFSYFPRAKKVVFTNKKLYHYRIREDGSIMNKYSNMKMKKFSIHLDVVNTILRFWNENGIYDKSGEMLSYFINFLYWDWKSFPEYLQIKFANRIVTIFEDNNIDLTFGKEYTYKMIKEIKQASQKKTSNAVDDINSMEESLSLIQDEIQKILSSKAYKIGKMLTPKKERIDENWIRSENNNRIF